MTVIAAPAGSRKAKVAPPLNSEASRARLFLAVACCWPLFILALFAASAPQLKDTRANPRALLDKSNEINKDVRFNFRKILDRVDIMGYGPTHPRVAVVVVGDDNKKILDSVESLYRHTALERIFLVCVVVEGRASDPTLAQELEKIDSGAVPHWHGLRADLHLPGESNADDKAAHGSRMQVLFNAEKRGVAESRADAVQFIHLLSEKHESTGLKSPQEDLLLLLLQSGAQFADVDWLHPVTGALIVPPPLISSSNKHAAALGAMKLANAVVFNTEGPGKRTSFDSTFTPIISDASTAEINLSDGNSYATPVWNGAAIAMRLNTFRNLPAQDPSLTEEWPANLELSLNLWLCADGMDVIKDLTITAAEPMPRNPLSAEMLARFAAAWMDAVTVDRIFHQYAKSFRELTHLEFETLMSKARGSQDFPIDLTERCRSFAWYAHHINTDITEALDTAGEELKEEEANHKAEEELREAQKKVDEEQQREREEKERLDKAIAEVAQIEAAQKEAAQKLASQMAAADKAAENAAAADALSDADGEEARPEMAHREDAPEKDPGEEGIPNMAQGEEAKEEIPAEKAKEEIPAEEVKPAEEEKPAEEVKPAEQENPAEEVNPAEQDKPAEEGDNGRLKPAVPLRPENLEIVRKAKPTDISFVDISNGHKEDPHMGAKDENGNVGYIHDETALRKNPPAMNFTDQELKEACGIRDSHYKMLHEKVVVDLEAHKAAEESGKKRDKIFCFAFTIEKFHDRIPALRETWGPKCDGFMVGSTKTDISLGTVEIPHEGPEEYNNIWQKMRSMWSYIYDNYYEKYDWFHGGGDDLFLIPENLRLYLESEEIKTAANGGIYLPSGDETTQTPLFLGRRFALNGDRNDIFISGGSGYTLNKAALKLLVTEAFPNYWPHAHTFSEDTMIAKLLRKLEVHPYDTKDETGAERYMPFLPGHHYDYKLPADPMNSNDWYAKYSIDIKEGLDHCSVQSVAFHYVKGKMMYRLFALLYNMCPAETM